MSLAKFILLLAFTISTLENIAQAYYFRHYQVEQGLSNNTVFCGAQDKKGFFWMGTKDGLNRFDGYSFKIFRNDPEDSSSIGDNFVRSLLIDSSDRLYAGTRNGLYRFDPVSETFTTILVTENEIRDIKKDNSGTIWLVAGQTVMRYNEAKKALKVFQHDKYFNATSVSVDRQGVVWVATASGYLQRYNDKTDSFTPYNLFDGSQPTTSRWIEKIYAANSPYILVGTSNFGVKLFNTLNGTYRNVLTYNSDRTEIFARDFIQSSGSEFWMATESGIFVYDTVTGDISNLKKHYNNPYSLSDNAVYCLYKDREGGIWAGTYFGGVNYYSRQYTSFQKFLPDNTPRSLSGNAVREICEDQYGNLWIGTEDAGLNKLDRKSGLFTQFKPTGTSTGISYSNIHGLLARNDELWIGTFEHGLNIMDIPTGKVIKHFPGSENSMLKSNFIITICHTKNGETFIGTRQGLYRFGDADKKFTLISQIPATAFIHSMMEDNRGWLWVGSMGSGLYAYDPATGATKHFIHDPQSKKTISNNSVTTIFEDSRNRLWLGTEGGGLNAFNASDSSFVAYKTKDGFPANTIFKILEDKGGNLWITTTRGLVCFDPRSKKLNVYTTASGLLSDQFNYNSGYKDAAGKMYFGSVKGMISFNPDTFIENEFVAPLFITSITVNNKEAYPSSPLTRSILFTNQIDLAYDQSTFSIDFAALSFTAPELTEYRYKLEGLDDQWTHLKANRKVYFTNLSPGTYVFKVNAAIYRGRWNDNDVSLVIKIHPPFWASGLAYGLYGLVLAIVAYILFRNYHRRIADRNDRKIELMQHEKEKEVYQAKIDFFTNVAHEIRTPLTLIKAPMEKIIKKAGENGGIDQNLRIMEKNTERLVELTNQLLDFSKVETKAFHLNFIQTNISEMLADRYESFRALAEQKGISLTLQAPEKPVIANVDPDSLDKILNNLFYNALNYGNTEVNVELFDEDGDKNYFRIEFKNDGAMIPASMREKIFEPFYRLQQTINRPGTGIGLTLSRSLAFLHKGELYLKETAEETNTFVVRLPVYQSGTSITNNGKPGTRI